jgi:methyltransferase
MVSSVAYTVLIGIIGLERIVELVVGRRNLAWSLARGGIEYGKGHWPPMVLLHTGLLIGCLVEVWWLQTPLIPALAGSMFALAVLSQVLRWWCIRTLGPRWNHRVIIIPGLSPIRSGPYRYFSHPNYLAVIVEGLALPLIHGAWRTALVFSILNACLLTVRIRCENMAIATLPPTDTP